MKIPNKNKVKKRKDKKKSVVKPKKEHVLLVAQEIKFARLLAGNEQKTRERALKNLKKWLLSCFHKGYEFKEHDFSRIWKGLFYAVWMSDKPLVQEELCENIAGILDLFPAEQYKHALLMAHVGFKTMATEWYGIDQHRMDKCLMLVRRYLRGSLRCVALSGWSETACKLYGKMLSGSDGILSLKTPVYARNATSMVLHFLDCYLEEIAKVSKANIPKSSLAELLRPICSYMCNGENHTIATAARKVLTELMRYSEHGVVYREKTKAWEMMGCPEGGPDALEPASDSDEGDDDEEINGDVNGDDDDESSPLDPRAGRVDVTLSPLPVPCEELAAILKDMIKGTSSKAHTRAKICMQRFEKLSQDEYPLKVPDPGHGTPDMSPPPAPRVAAKSLQALEKSLLADSDELAFRGLSRKHRKRLLAKRRNGLSIIEDTDRQTKSTTDISINNDINDREGQKKLIKSNKDDRKRSKRDRRSQSSDASAKPQIKKAKIKQIDKGNTEVNIESGRNQLNDFKKKKDRNSETKDVSQPPVKKGKTPEKQLSSKSDNVASFQKRLSKKQSPKSGSVASKTKDFQKQLSMSNKQTSKQSDNVASKVNGFQKQLSNKPSSPKNDGIANKTSFQKQLSMSNKQTASKSEGVASSKNKNAVLVSKKVKNFPKSKLDNLSMNSTPKRVKFVLKNNSMQETFDYYKSVRQSPNIPFDGSKKPSKTNLKISSPSPINPFFKKKMRMKGK